MALACWKSESAGQELVIRELYLKWNDTREVSCCPSNKPDTGTTYHFFFTYLSAWWVFILDIAGTH